MARRLRERNVEAERKVDKIAMTGMCLVFSVYLIVGRVLPSGDENVKT